MSATIKITPSPGATEYRVTYGPTDPPAEGSTVIPVASMTVEDDKLSVVVPGIQPGHFVQVEAGNAYGYSSPIQGQALIAVALTSPEEAAVLNEGDTVVISGTSTGGLVDLEFTVDNEIWLPIAEDVDASTGAFSYEWTALPLVIAIRARAEGVSDVVAVTVTPAEPLLLDAYAGSLAAYSLDKLSNTATASIRVRRSSDDAEQDIGFVDNRLDTASLLSFVGAGDGFVVKWYGQNGAGDFVPDGVQAKIVENGVLVVNEYGAPAVRHTGVEYYSVPITASTDDLSVFFVSDTKSAIGGEDYVMGFRGPTLGPYPFIWEGQEGIRFRCANQNLSTDSGRWDFASMVRSVRTSGTTIEARLGYRVQFTSDVLGTHACTEFRLGGGVANWTAWAGLISEIVVYPSLSVADHEAVTHNIGSRWFGLQPKKDALLNTTYPDQQVIYDWLGSLTEEDVTLPALAQPAYTGTYNTEDELADLWLSLRMDGDGDYNLTATEKKEPAWYLLDSGEPSVSPAVTKRCTIDEAAPDTPAPDTLQIKEAAGARKFAFFEIDLSGLTSAPTAVDLGLSGTTLSSEDAVTPYIGAKVYTGIALDPQTATWNAPPVDLTTNPVYDDIEGLSDGEASWQLYLHDQIRAAYDASQTSVVVALYNVNVQYNSENLTQRTVTIADAPAVTIHQARGIEATGAVRFPMVFSADERRAFGEKGAYWYGKSHPSLVNPMYQLAPLGRRSLVAAAVHLLQTDLYCLQNSYVNRSDFIGGWLTAVARIYKECKGLLSSDVQAAFEAGMMRLMDRIIRLGAQDVNSNMDTKAVDGCAIAYSATENTLLRTRAVECAKSQLFGYTDGQIDTLPYKIDSDKGIFFLEGNIREADGPTLGYFGRSLFHMTSAYTRVRGDANWSFLSDVLARCAKWLEAQWVADTPTTYIGGNGFDSRVPSMPDSLQQLGVWTPLVLSEIDPAGTRMIRKDGASRFATAATMASAIQSELAKVDYTEDDTLPPVWDDGEPWTMEVIPQAETGWYSTLKALVDVNDPSTFPVGDPRSGAVEADDVFPPVAESDGALNHGAQFWRRKRLDSAGKQWGFFVEAAWFSGSYEGFGSGKIESLWMEDIGAVIISQRFYQQLPNDTIDTYPLHHTWGKDDKATPTIFNVSQENGSKTLVTRQRTITFDADNQYLEITTPFGIADGAGRGDTAGDEIQGSASERKRFTALQNGLQVDVSILSDQTDLVKELWHTLPIRYVTGTQMEYWTGAGYALMALGGTYTGVRYIRVSRDQTNYWYLDLGAEKTVKTGSALRADTLNLHVNIHPTGDGTAQALPNGQVLSFTILTPAGDPGFSGTAMSVAITKPTAGTVYPEGSPMAVYFELSGGTAPYTFATEVSTDGENFTPLAQTFYDLGSGKYEGLGGAVPTGLTHVRVVVTDADTNQITSSAVAVSSSALSLLIRDTFTDTPGTLMTAHTPDVGGPWVFNNGDKMVISPSGTSVVGDGTSATKRMLINPGSPRVLVEIRYKLATTSGPAYQIAAAAVRARPENLSEHVLATHAGTTLYLDAPGTDNDVVVTGVTNKPANEWAKVRMYATTNDFAVASFYDANDSLVRVVANWNVTNSYHYAGLSVGFSASANETDYVEVYGY